MGSSLSIIEMDDDNDGVLMELLNTEDYDYQEHLLNVLQRMVNRQFTSRGVIRRNTTMRMPIIGKRPDLTVFRTTPLYEEVMNLSGCIRDQTSGNEHFNLNRILQNRENGLGRAPNGAMSTIEARRIANHFTPNRKTQRLMTFESKVFCGTLSKSGDKLITASQDDVIRVYDASKGTYHRVNRIKAVNVSYCILDIDFSPDEQYFAYSTWSEYLHICRVDERGNNIHWLHVNPEHTRSCIFSIRFSPCGKYIIGGANDGCVYIYDRTTDSRSMKVNTTDADEHVDINSVCYIDNNVFVSGCDDGIIKVWDRRCLGSDSSDQVQMFYGHFDGITHIDSRNDGVHILSNSKDQSIKIWDLRRPSPSENEANARKMSYNWDYRWDTVPRVFYNPQKTMDGDSSIMTYRGHRVTKSLIRAKFSPMEQTGQRYIYTGCGTGRVIIYDVLTGNIKEAIEGHRDIVRDVAWHPVRPEIVSTSWDTHVNLNTFSRPNTASQKRATSTDHEDVNKDHPPLRRSRRIAMRNSEAE